MLLGVEYTLQIADSIFSPSSKKPSLELYARFRHVHPDVVSGAAVTINAPSNDTEYFADACFGDDE